VQHAPGGGFARLAPAGYIRGNPGHGGGSVLSLTRAARCCAALAAVWSLTLAQAAGQEDQKAAKPPAGAPADNTAPEPAKDKDKPKAKPAESGDAEDLARTLQQ